MTCKHDDYAELASDELLRMHELAEQILDLNRPRDPSAQRSDPLTVAREVARLATAGADDDDIRLTVNGEAGLAAGIAPDALKQVMLNLVQNAREAVAQAGIATPQIAIDIGDSVDGIVIRVSDNGPGVPAELRTLTSLRSRFLRQKGKGCGRRRRPRLVCRRGARAECGWAAHDRRDVVRQDRRDVRRRASGGVGTSRGEQRAIARGDRMTPGKILVVDDDATFRLTTAALLQADGHEVETAGDGQQAVERLRDRQFDLLLVDLRMPGIDGIGLVEALRLWGHGIPILMISGFGTVCISDAAVRALHVGVDDFLLKPVEPDVLERAGRRSSRATAAMVAQTAASNPGGIVGNSAPMRALLDRMQRVACD